MTLLTAIRSACGRIGLQRPTTVISATDQTARTLLEFANEEGENLAAIHPWRKLRKEKTFTTVAAEQQTSSLPSDLLRFVDDAFWNRTRKHPLTGPLDAREWQAVQAWTGSPVTDAFTVRGDYIYINPAPPSGETMAYEYVSKNWVLSSGNYYDSFQADADETLVPEKIITLGVVWRFKQSKGIAWEGDYGKYETQLRQAMMDDQPSPIIQLGASRVRRPGVVVPEGDWNL